MFPLQFVDAIADAMEAVLGASHHVQTEPCDLMSRDKTVAVFPVAWTPEIDTMMIGGREPTINHYQIRVQNLSIHSDVYVAYTEFTTTQRKIRAILYRDATLRLSLAGMTEVYLGSTERFQKLHVVQQRTMPSRMNLGMYFLCETDVQIDTETVQS